MSRILILGGTNKESLGRQLALLGRAAGLVPVLVGRTAQTAAQDPELAGCEFITADLLDPQVGHQVMAGLGNAADVVMMIIAGGGPHLRGRLGDHSLQERIQLLGSVVQGPLEVLVAFHANTSQPYHLITVASTSAVMRRTDETVYATAQTARRAIAINFNHELTQRPGAKNLIVCPGGMKTGLWQPSVNTTSYMDPAVVATIIWQTARTQSQSLAELTIKRNPNGRPEPRVTYP